MVKDLDTGYLQPSANYKLTGFTADLKKLAIEMLAKKMNVGKVCKAIGINRQHFYLAMIQDPKLAQDYQNVKDGHLDDIVDTMYDKAKIPTGVGTLPAIFLLKTQRPEQYGDKVVIQHQSKTPIHNLFDELKSSGQLIDVEMQQDTVTPTVDSKQTDLQLD